MSLDLGFGSQKSTTKEKVNRDQTSLTDRTNVTQGATNSTGTQESNPWSKTIPGLESYLSSLTSRINASGTPTQGQSTAADQYRATLQPGQNPYSFETDRLVNDMFGTASRSGDVMAAYGDLDQRLRSTANGENVNLNANPYVAAMMDKSARDATTRVNEMFANAGRDFSGANMAAVGTAVTEAQQPILAQLYQYEQGRSDDAARALFDARTGSATTAQGLDRDATNTRTGALGVASGGQALADQIAASKSDVAADRYNFETALADKSLQDFSQLGQLLYGAAGLGSSTSTNQTQTQQLIDLLRQLQVGNEKSEGTSKSKGSSTQVGGNLKLF